MTEQLEISFPTKSPINVDKLSGQNKKLYDYLKEGNTIHCFSEARRKLRIGYLNSRASDLKKAGVHLYKRYIKVKNYFDEETTVKEYSLNPFDQ